MKKSLGNLEKKKLCAMEKEIAQENDRTCLLAKFNSMSTKDLQDSFLTGLITVCDVTRKQPRKENPIKFDSNSHKYEVF